MDDAGSFPQFCSGDFVLIGLPAFGACTQKWAASIPPARTVKRRSRPEGRRIQGASTRAQRPVRQKATTTGGASAASTANTPPLLIAQTEANSTGAIHLTKSV